MGSYSRSRVLDEFFDNIREYQEKLEDLELLYEVEEIFCELLDDGTVHARFELY